MRIAPSARRVVIVVLDGLRPDAIERFGLTQLATLVSSGASTLSGTTVAPSVTAAALTSLMTGVCPATHGLASDRVFIPRPRPGLVALPDYVARHGMPSSGFMGEVPALFRGVAARIGRRLGLTTLHLRGRGAADILAAARDALRVQQRGLIVLHWPDADRAGHEHGWMSRQYAEGCHQLDSALRSLCRLANDGDTLFVGLADHGGGGVKLRDHESDHPLDRTIPILLWGADVIRTPLQSATLLDVAPTILHALGLEIPGSFEGRVLHEAFARREAPEPAVA